ncbi:hypothetical protein B0A52_03880 [Exophiala mesophila]|uniref:AB hydrolase-1 domain-containing protein n=1 Tax=Exophiala mesophila TaxID=212818 RepID=A0A438N7R7_EXOME|nr:hypothetical protein B0A52_03880 [Exophiala mesophila]
MGKPVFILVPGAAAPAKIYRREIARFNELGYEAETVPTPSVGRRDPLPPATMDEDAVTVRNVAMKYINQGKDVNIVTHSYGGLPGTEAVRGISKKVREAKGLKGGVSRIIYVTSVVLPVGGKLSDAFEGGMPSFLKVVDEYLVQPTPEENTKIVFYDIPEAEAIEWAREMEEHSFTSYAGPLTYAAWNDVPVSYFFCENDTIIPPQAQQGGIDLIEKESGQKVDVHRLQAGHAPQANFPGRIPEMIIEKIVPLDA